MAIVCSDDGSPGKICNKCGEWKSVGEFSFQRANTKNGGDGYHYTCKDCHNAARRIERKANRDAINAHRRAYYRQHREAIIASVRAYRQANPERVKATNKAYYERNRELRKQAQIRRSKLRRATQPDQVRAYYRNYYRQQKQTNPEKLRAHERKNEHRRRNRKFQAQGFHTDKEWEQLKAFYDYLCLCCRRREPDIVLTRDHVIPLVQGGTDWITNIQPLCSSCNSSKGSNVCDYRISWMSGQEIINT